MSTCLCLWLTFKHSSDSQLHSQVIGYTSFLASQRQEPWWLNLLFVCCSTQVNLGFSNSIFYSVYSEDRFRLHFIERTFFDNPFSLHPTFHSPTNNLLSHSICSCSAHPIRVCTHSLRFTQSFGYFPMVKARFQVRFYVSPFHIFKLIHCPVQCNIKQ